MNVNPNARQSTESFKAYRARLKAMHAAERNRQPRVLWDSQRKGTYIKLRDGYL